MWYTISIGEVIKKLRSNLNTGLEEEQICKIRDTFGENKLSESKKESYHFFTLKAKEKM